MTEERSRDAVDILDRRIGDDLELHREVERDEVHSHVASLIHDARARAELTQKQLAEFVGNSSP